MRLRIAKKIERAARRAPLRHTRDQVRRACLRLYASPLQVTSNEPLFPHGGADAVRLAIGYRSRALVISPRLAVFEQRRALHDVIRERGRLRIMPRFGYA